jgi:hypothetical protein
VGVATEFCYETSSSRCFALKKIQCPLNEQPRSNANGGRGGIRDDAVGTSLAQKAVSGDSLHFGLDARLRRRRPPFREWPGRRTTGDHLLAGRYAALLTQSRGVHVADISRDHLRAAAQLRAATGVKMPDSLQAVAALAAGSQSFLTNDRDLPTITSLRILQLSSCVRRSCRSSLVPAQPA